MRKTDIICTIGPASDTEEVVKGLFEGGLNISRHNFSHGDHKTHRVAMELVRKVGHDLGKSVEILLDTKGPEIRTGSFLDKEVELIEGNDFTIICGGDIIGDTTKCSVTYGELCKFVKAGDHILIADGLVALKVNSISGKEISCTVENTGVIGNNKNVNVPGVVTNLPAVTEKDEADLKFGIEMKVDYIAASFIRKAEDVLEIRKILEKNNGKNIKIISKIENHEGVHNIDEIIKVSDGIMVARGDLGVEMPLEELPLVQKMIINKCNDKNKKVVVATQMLDSMTRNPRPTRAEVSDVANAIIDGANAIMLSGETANGKYPVETVKVMATIAETTEDGFKGPKNNRRFQSIAG